MNNITVTVTIEDLHTDTVTSIQEPPEHLVEYWDAQEIAEWAVGNDDATMGRPVVPDWSTEIQWYGMYGGSYVDSYRAGARYLVTVNVAQVRADGTVL